MNKEQVYDDQISPLMQQIINLCKAKGISMIASFDIAHDGEGPNGEDCSALLCTTLTADESGNPNQTFAKAAALIQRGGHLAVAMITTSRGDGSKTLTAII